MPDYRSIRETPLYSQQLSEFGDIKVLDEALEGVMWALARNAEHFPEIPNTNIRCIKTLEFERSNTLLLPLKIWFTIIDENTVLLLSISQDTIEYGFNDDWGDDEIPF